MRNNKNKIFWITAIMIFLMVSSLAAFTMSMDTSSQAPTQQEIIGDMLITVKCGNTTYPVSVNSNQWDENNSGIMLGDQECEVL